MSFCNKKKIRFTVYFFGFNINLSRHCFEQRLRQ